MFRKIINPKNRKELLLQLPEEFVGNKVEILIFDPEVKKEFFKNLIAENLSEQEQFERFIEFARKNSTSFP